MGRLLLGMLLLALILAGAVAFWFLWPSRNWDTPGQDDGKTAKAEDAGLVGSVSCRECHEPFYQKWAPSHHGLAMQSFTPKFARKNLVFEKREIKVGSSFFQPMLKGEAGIIRERKPDGTTRDYPMVQVLGGKNVCYFLTPLERGRLQVLPLAYKVKDRKWYDMPGSGVRHFTDAADAPLDWRHSAFTFNTSCYSCHVSQLARNYDPGTDTYHTTWAEPGINCETCHGPGGEHVRTFKAAALRGEKPVDLKLISTRSLSFNQANDACAPCHAKMSPLTAGFTPGQRYFDHFDLITLENRDFYPDGRDLGENYTFTSWRQSPCVQPGELSCLHCHTSSGRNKHTGANANQACMPCHQDKVNNPTAHTRHKADSPGNQCVSCHMPRTDFAAMQRSDHSMRPPMPAATLAFKSPNACNMCHMDKDAAWADQVVRQWRPRDYQAPVLRRGKLIEAARKQDWARLPEMLEEITSPKRQEVVAASLLRLLGACSDPRVLATARQAFKDESPLVRAAAVDAVASFPPKETAPLLLDACGDEYRLVRVRACAALGGVYPSSTLHPPPSTLHSFERAQKEYVASIMARPDQWSSHYNQGNYHQARGEVRKAIKAFETAIRLEPTVLLPYVNLSIAYAQVERKKDAENALKKALELDPENAAANLNLGLLLGEEGRSKEAQEHLRKAMKRDPNLAAAAYNLSVLLAQEGKLEEAISWIRTAYRLDPSGKHGFTLAFYLRQKGADSEAISVLRSVLRQDPGQLDSCLLLGDLLEKQGRKREAQELYHETLRLPGLTDQQRRFLQTRIQKNGGG